MSKKITTITVGMLALLLMLATPSFAQKVGKPMKSMRTTAIDQAKMKSELMKKYPALAKAPKSLVQSKSTLERTITGQLLKVDKKALKAGDGQRLLGHIIYDGEEAYQNGLYFFNSAEDPGFEEYVIESKFANKNGGGVIIDNVYYYTELWEFLGYIFPYRYAYDLEAREWVINEESIDNIDFLGLEGCVSYDEATNLSYGVFYNADGTDIEFGAMDYPNWTRTTLPTPEHMADYLALAADGKGNVYAIAYTGEVYKVDVTTGQETLVASTGITANYIQAAAANGNNNKLYWAFINQDGSQTGIAEIDLTNGTTNISCVFPTVMEFSFLQAMKPEAEPNAPARATNLKAYIESAAPNNVYVSFSLPTTTFDETTPLEGMLEYSIYVNGEQKVKGSGQPGAQIIRMIENVPSGMTTISVVVRNVVGDGATAKTKLWVGADAPASPVPATLAIDDNNHAVVKWTAPTLEGVHGGYVDTDAVTYTVVRYPDEAVVADGIQATSFEEDLDASELKVYKYGIVAKYGDAESEEAITNAVKLGTSLLPPFADDFSEIDNIMMYTVIDANEDGKTWDNASGSMRYTYSSTNDADDWLVTPNISLNAGKLYNLYFTVRGMLSTYPETIEVLFGKGDDPTAFEKVILDPTVLTDEPLKVEVPLIVEEDGNYKVAFHAISDADMYYLVLDNWGISAPIDFAAPNKSTDLEVVTVSGALNGDLKFVAPTKAVDNSELTEITKIEVAKGGEVLATIENAAPGAPLSVPVAVDARGIYTYDVTAYNSHGVGLTASVSAFIGVDDPDRVYNIAAYDNFDGTATFTWDAATDKGVNGGYIDPASITYRIYAIEEGSLADVLAETKETQYVASAPSLLEGPFDIFQIAISTFVGEGDDEVEGPIYVGALVAGTPKSLPYYESFGGSSVEWWVNTINGNAWSLYEGGTDADGACAGHVAQSDNCLAQLNSSKISVKGAANPKMIFQWVSTPGVKVTVNAVRQKQGEAPVVLKELETIEVAETYEWKQEVIDLSQFAADPYFYLSFVAEATQAGAAFQVDDIRIYDVYSNDLVLELSTPRSVGVGEEMTAIATISNPSEASVAPGDYSVVFSVNGKVVDTVTDFAAIAPYTGKTIVTSKYVPGVIDGNTLNVKAEVVYNFDLEPENNVAENTVNVKLPKVPTVTDLTAETGGWPAVELKWSAPQPVEVVEGEVVTEDFEDLDVFAPFSTGGITADVHTGAFGNWKLYDGTLGYETYGFQSSSYENMGVPMAFQVFNPVLAGFDLTGDAASTVGPNSGDQFLMSMCVADANKTPQIIDTDHWLISPLLSGEEQTISFFVSEITTQYGNETFEVWCSNTDSEIASFEKIYSGAVTTTDWTEISVELPAGAKYFAIRHTAKDIFGFELDDITFTAASAKNLSRAAEDGVTGYNIYRDGKLIATVGADVFRYIDVNETDGEHTYYVTALYGNVESGLSNGATVVTAISEIAADASLNDADITVYSTSGAVIASGKGVYGTLAKGVYVIKNNVTGAVKGVTKK